MAVPPKSMKSGLYWVQKHLKYNRSASPRALPTRVKLTMQDQLEDIDRQCKEVHRQLLEPCSKIEGALVGDIDELLAKHVDEYNEQFKKILSAKRITKAALRKLSHCLLNYSVNMSIVDMTNRGINNDWIIVWSKTEKVLSLGGNRFLSLPLADFDDFTWDKRSLQDNNVNINAMK